MTRANPIYSCATLFCHVSIAHLAKVHPGHQRIRDVRLDVQQRPHSLLQVLHQLHVAVTIALRLSVVEYAPQEYLTQSNAEAPGVGPPIPEYIQQLRSRITIFDS